MFNPPVMMTTNERDAFKYEAIVKFNFMDRPETRLITIDCNDSIQFGNYSIIENSLRSQYSIRSINESMWLQEKYAQTKPKKDKEDENAVKKKAKEEAKEEVKNCVAGRGRGGTHRQAASVHSTPRGGSE